MRTPRAAHSPVLAVFGPLLLLLLLLACAGGCGSGPAPAAQFVDQAERLHSGALASAATRDEYVGRYVQEVGRRLVRAAADAAPQKARNPLFAEIQFHLVQSDTVNAFTTGGRHVYVYSALMQVCDSEDELAAAMAHEYAHALNLDVERTGMKPLPDAPPVAIAELFVNNRFSLLQEREADELAFQLYTRGGWDPTHYGDLYDKLARLFPLPAAPDRIPDAGRGDAARVAAVGSQRDWHRLPVADRRTFQDLRRAAVSQPLGTALAQTILRALPNCMLSSDTPQQQQAQKELRPPPPPAVRLEPS